MLVRVLCLSQEPAERRRLGRMLETLGTLVSSEGDPDALWARLGSESFDLLVISRDCLPEPHGTTLAEVRNLPERPEVIVLTDEEDPTVRGRLQAAGTFAVVGSAVPDTQLEATLSTLLGRYREIGLSRLVSGERGRSRLDDTVSRSAAMQRLLALARRVAPTDTSLLLLGETGVGKEWLARAIHAQGPRAAGPFLALNCAAVPEGLLESELFGHEKGAFTGALRARRGAFELAHRGTLFLDEVGDLPVHLQVKLLRALQERRIQRVGAEREIEVDVRIMAATNRDLDRALHEGEFRQDLYYRLSVVTLTLPPLRARREDIEPLAQRFLAHFRTQLGRPRLRGFEPEAIEALTRYAWPGNVRELINVLERAVILSDGDTIGTSDLPEAIAGAPAENAEGAAAGPRLAGLAELPLEEARRRWIEGFEREYLARLLRRQGGHVGRTAAQAGIDPRTLYNKMRAHGLDRREFR